MIQGGNAINVIPDHAVIKADARAFTPEEFDRVETSQSACQTRGKIGEYARI